MSRYRARQKARPWRTHHSINLHTHNVKPLILLALLFILAACASPKQTSFALQKTEIEAERTRHYTQAFTYQLKQRARLAEVAQPLLESSIHDCPSNTRYSLGIFLHSLQSYTEQERPAAEQLYQLNETPKILYVLNNGAANPQLKTGDQLLKVNDQQAPKNITKLQRLIAESIKKGDPVSFLIQRNNEPRTVTITPHKICAYPILYSNSDTINGYADGHKIIITAGLMRVAKQDPQLALIIAHELAHNTLHHINQRLTNTALGGLIDIALISSGVISPFIGAGLGANLHTQAYEIEADLEGLRLMHQAGFEIEGLDQFWQTMASIHPSTISQGIEMSHPTTVERALLIRKKIVELKQKKLRHHNHTKLLSPNY